eukprot:651136-Pyramimonas_sp.AAC.1
MGARRGAFIRARAECHPVLSAGSHHDVLTRLSLLVFCVYVGAHSCAADTHPRDTRAGKSEFGGTSPARSEKLDVTHGFRVRGRARINSSGAAFDHPGVSILARFTGTSVLTATMSRVGDISNAFVVYCDGKRMAGGRYGGSTFNTSSWPIDGQQVSGIRLCGNLDPEEDHEVQVGSEVVSSE